MDVPTLMHNLREEVTCSVCFHLFKEPKQLPCLHVFCLECLNGLAWTNAREGKIKCPICQIEVAVPDCGTMETLPACFHLKNLLDILAIKECNTSKVTCGNCDNKSDEASYCFQCCKFWCKECLNAHSILRENKEHRVLALKDFKDEDFDAVIKRPAFCSKDFHERKVLKFYCKVCQVPICKNCVTLEHCKHDVEPLEKISAAVRNRITSKLEGARIASDDLSNTLREIEEDRRLVENHFQTVKQQIQKTFKTAIEALQDQERELMRELETKAEDVQEKLIKDKENCQSQLRKCQETVSQVARILNRSTGAELVRTETSVSELFQEVNEGGPVPVSVSPFLKNVFSQNQDLHEILQNNRLGRLVESTTEASQCSVERFEEATAGLESRFQLITRNFEGQRNYFRGDNVVMEIVSVEHGTEAVGMKVVDQENGTYTVSFIPARCGLHSVTVKVNGSKLRDLPPFTVKERSFEPVLFLGEEKIENKFMNRPWGVAVYLCEIFVTDRGNDRILVFTEKGKFIKSFGHNLVNEPSGIAIDNEGRIFVASAGDNKVLLFNPRGEYVKIVHSEGSLLRPLGLSLTQQGNPIVCDSKNRCIKIFSASGNLMKTIGKGRLKLPLDCAFHDNKIYVSDKEADLIKVYNSKSGKFIFEFAPHDSYGEKRTTLCVAIDKTGHLLVTRADRVNVFTLDGIFVTSFGTTSVQFPCGVSVLQDGRIIVTDFIQNRLQIFA